MGFILVIIGLVVSAFFYLSVRDLPSVDGILKQGVSPTHYAQVYGADGSVILSYGKFRHENVKLSQVSPYFIQALLATEDRRFYDHHGVDPLSLARAIGRDVMHRKLLEGGSTLTQQLARNVFLSNERSFRRKIREAMLAVELENHLTKKQILELYVNNIYFGEGAYGIAAASEIYFGKAAKDLTMDEAAMLAGMPQAPSNYSPFRNADSAYSRRNEVLQNLQEWGKLSPKEVTRLKQKKFRLNPAGLTLGNADKAPFFNRYVLRQIQSQFDLDEQSFWQSGLKIYTTLSPRAQAIASQVVREQSANYGRNKLVQQAALLSIDPKTGGILAYVGGKNYQQSQFDRVAQATRSPGSLFKVFTYAAAMEKGISPFKNYTDEPIFFGGWQPENFDKGYHGTMPLYRAFYTSNNVIAVKLLRDLQPTTVIDLARRMGLNATLADNLSLTLGGSGVTLLDITAAIGVLANQGIRNEAYAIERIVDEHGEELYKHHALPNQVLKRTTVDTMVSLMQMVLTRGTARNAYFGHPAAGKTGTSDDHRDAWFIGFTPGVITGVWVGNDDNTSMPGMVGGALPATIWRNFMQSYLADKMQTPFDLPFSQMTTHQKTAPADDTAETTIEPTDAPVETYETPPAGEDYLPPEVQQNDTDAKARPGRDADPQRPEEKPAVPEKTSTPQPLDTTEPTQTEQPVEARPRRRWPRPRVHHEEAVPPQSELPPPPDAPPVPQ
jgi:penicillin-binding protein 1A